MYTYFYYIYNAKHKTQKSKVTRTLKKIVHRNAYRIAVFFPFNQATNNKLKSLGATYSRTYRCWHFNYSSENYNTLKANFSDIVIDGQIETLHASKPVAGQKSRDLPPIDPSNAQKTNVRSEEPKLPAKAEKAAAMEHKAVEIPLAKKLNVQLKENLGKYWVFTMYYQPSISKALLKVKGIYWNKRHKTYLAYRNFVVKQKADYRKKEAHTTCVIVSPPICSMPAPIFVTFRTYLGTKMYVLP